MVKLLQGGTERYSQNSKIAYLLERGLMLYIDAEPERRMLVG
ncbi:hypothetical protein [Photorhabdus caribbeanensis]|nr:hypothetical protein [Photorhabdus caribbeanensis]